MKNYIKADLIRIATHIPRLFLLAAMNAVFILIVQNFSKYDTFNSVTYLSMLGQYCNFLPICIGVIELVAVYSTDFKAKTMQFAIGIGVKKEQVILTKLLEMIVMVLFDLAIIIAVVFICGAIFGVSFTSWQLLEVFSRFLMIWLKVSLFMSISMIAIFFTQGTGLAMILYLIMASGFSDEIISSLVSSSFLSPLRINLILPSSLLDTLMTRMILGNFSIGRFIGILIYIVLGYIVTVLIFRKRELEF